MPIITTMTPATANRGKFVPGFEPETIALRHTVGTPVHSQFGGDQIQFVLADNRKWYCDFIVAQKLEQMRIQPGEPFSVCKVQTQRGQQRIVEIEIRAVVEPLADDAPYPPLPSTLERQLQSSIAHQQQKQQQQRTQPAAPPAPTAAIAATNGKSAPMNGNGETSATHLTRCYRDAVDIAVSAVAYAKERGLAVAPDFADLRALAATIAIAEGGRR